MPFKKDVKTKALIACKRHCVLCERDKGVSVECHHIKPQSEGGEDTFENCIPLCFDCHEKVGSYNPKHPKGNQYSESELIQRRDAFYKRVENNQIPIIVSDNPGTIFIETPKKCDVELFDKIKKIFNHPNLKIYLTELDLGNDFDNSVFLPLSELYFDTDNPDYEFVDEEIEDIKKTLMDSIGEFLAYKAVNTFPTHLNTQALKTWKNDDFEYEEAQKMIQEFNDLATDVWSKYTQLNRLCKKKM